MQLEWHKPEVAEERAGLELEVARRAPAECGRA
jgi:hypothetical protein